MVTKLSQVDFEVVGGVKLCSGTSTRAEGYGDDGLNEVHKLLASHRVRRLSVLHIDFGNFLDYHHRALCRQNSGLGGSRAHEMMAPSVTVWIASTSTTGSFT